jgi:WD40 repeat protein
VALLEGGSAADLEVSPDGSKVIVTGSNAGDFATVAYAATSGAQLWVARYNGPGNGQDSAHSLAASPDGTKVFVSGASTGATGGLDYATVAYAATAGAPVQLWVARYDGPGNDRDVARSLGVSPDGTRVFVTGESHGESSDLDYATIAYDASSGATRWVVRYGGPHEDVASSLGVSPDGTQVFVTGYDSVGSSDNVDHNYATIAYDTQSGARLWTRRYSSVLRGGEDRAVSIDVSPDGSEVFVTGTSVDGRAVALATVAYYGSSGDSLWVSRYVDPSDQAEATAIVASPDGTSVFVTGDLFGINTSFVTIAYSTR